MNTEDAIRIIRSRGTVPTGYTTLGASADALIEEIERLRTENAELRRPDYYWDDRDLDSAVATEDAVAFDDVGDIIELRPVHELPTQWALVTEKGPVWFDSREAAQAAGGE